MMLGQPEGEHYRVRLGIIFLVIGLLLVLWAWGSWVFRVSAGSPENPTGAVPIREGGQSPSEPPASAGADARGRWRPEITATPGFQIASRPAPKAALASFGGAPPGRSPPDAERLVPLTALTVLLLLIVFLFGAFAIVIGTRRWQALAAHKRAPPTPNADVWAMHKLPDDLLDE
jgi:amino acid transporter